MTGMIYLLLPIATVWAIYLANEVNIYWHYKWLMYGWHETHV